MAQNRKRDPHAPHPANRQQVIRVDKRIYNMNIHNVHIYTDVNKASMSDVFALLALGLIVKKRFAGTPTAV